jgi:hypothetical protein
MNICPCCGHTMIREILDHQASWFCRNCWQVMPLLEREIPAIATGFLLDTPSELDKPSLSLESDRTSLAPGLSSIG